MQKHRFARALGDLAARVAPAVAVLLSALLAARCESLDGGVDPAPKQASSVETSRLINSVPLSADTWSTWRDHYARIFYEPMSGADDRTFYRKIHSYVLETVTKPGNVALKSAEADSLYWVVLAYAYLNDASNSRHLDLAESACRKGIGLGDSSALASYGLAAVLLDQAERHPPTASTAAARQMRLREVEERIAHIEATVPKARLSLLRGRLESLRGRNDLADKLLRRATEDDPLNDNTALTYLSKSLSQADTPHPATNLTDRFVKRFPDNARIKAMHAIALYRDQRFPEAADTLQLALQQDATIAQMIGGQGVRAIEDGRALTPKVVEGIKAIKERRYEAAVALFRQVCSEMPDNPQAARWLADAMLGRINEQLSRRNQSAAADAVREIARLCRRFPRDGELRAAYAAALFSDRHFAEAKAALLRAEELGADATRLVGPMGVAAIRAGQSAAAPQRVSWQRRAQSGEADSAPIALVVLEFFAVWGMWIVIMFAVGAILAAAIPRKPPASSSDVYVRSVREIWLERFYLVLLGLGLLAFYVVVPFVAVGLFSVTLALFGALLIVRIIHFGVLHRGLWATWGIVRCAFLAPRENTLRAPITEVEHPRLFEASREVAGRLNTEPADAVYLTPTSQIGVHQGGSGPFGLFGKRTRVLEIGVATLPMLTISEFKSILAHEYGHFTHKDPFFGRFIFQVTTSLAASMSVMNAAGGTLNYINPFYWFYWLNLKAYNLISAGFSRSREFLADRRATIAYGKPAFVGGLTKVTIDGRLYDATAYQNVRWLLSNQQMFVNVFQAYRDWRESPDLMQKRDSLLEQARQQKTSWFDTHPNFSERLAAIALFPNEPRSLEDDSAAALLTDLNAIETHLTNMLTQRLIQLPPPSAQPSR
jgi:Zn-dependent protease with chaperone function